MSERSRALRKSFYVRLAAAGFAMIFLSVIVAGATGNATGAFSVGPPGVIALIVGLVLATTGRGLILAIVVAFFSFVLFVVFESTGDVLRHPESYSDFVPAVLRAVGSTLALAGSLVALVQARRGLAALRSGSRTEKRLVKGGAAALVVLAAVSVALTYTRNADIDAPPGAIVVETLADDFDPREVRLEPGRNQVLVVNRDSYAHTFGSDVLGIDTYIGPRADRLITVDVPNQPGDHDLYCSVTGHEDMTGTIVIAD